LFKPFRNLLPFLAVLASVAFLPVPASAACYTYTEGQADCSGADGCTGTYTYTYCVPGCISGTCGNYGNSGSCCGERYFNAQLIPDGGVCHGGDCDEVVFRPHPRAPKAVALRGSVFRRDYTPGFVMIGPQLSQRDAQLVYVYDRCNRTYALVLQDAKILAQGGS
jgi:hypothetical protein